MKLIKFAFLGLLLSSCASMGEVVPQGEQHPFESVHEVNLSKKEIYNRSLEWMAKTFVDSKAVIELKDPEAGKIIGKGITGFTNMGLAYISTRFTLVIDAKDGKYRTNFSDFVALWDSGNNPRPLEYRNHINEVMANVQKMDDDLKQFVIAEKKDW